MTNETMTTKFKAGQKYMMLNQPVMVTRRTDKTIWFDFYGETFSRRVKLLENKEYVDYDQHHSIFSTITPNEPQDTPNETDTEPTITMTTIERQALIESFNHYATSLHSFDYGSQEYDEIWEKMMSIHDKIKNLITPTHP